VYLYSTPPVQNIDEDDSAYWERVDKWQYFVDPTKLSEVPIDDYIKDNEIKYLSIPIISSSMEDEFESGMKYTDNDIQSVIEKLESKLDWISILLPKGSREYEYDEEITSSHSFLEGVDFDELVKLGHLKSLPSYKFVKTIKLFEGFKNQLYLPFEVPEKRFYFSLSSSAPRQELFIRNVLIKDFHFTLPIAASVFDISTIVLNVNSRKFIPDISRNTIDSNSEYELNYVVGKAIHLGAIARLELAKEEQAALQSFVLKFYEKVSEFEKRQ
jgi:hypothetical protein